MSINLNEIGVPIEHTEQVQQDFSTTTPSVAVYFKELERRLIEHIDRADVVVGCVAWLTSAPILEALSKKQVLIVVQKEDFLRPDLGARRDGWPKRLRAMYAKVRFCLERWQLPGMARRLSVCVAHDETGVRCVGNHNRERHAAAPRAHHKFVVFGKLARLPSTFGGKGEERVVPYGVWTGSFNFTKNATASFENAVYLEDQTIVDAFVNEFGQVLALSEELDWTSDWCAPEYRIGT